MEVKVHVDAEGEMIILMHKINRPRRVCLEVKTQLDNPMAGLHSIRHRLERVCTEQNRLEDRVKRQRE